MNSENHLDGSSDVDCLDIGWIMDSIDIESVLDRLNINITSRKGEQLWGYCPDHSLFVGTEASHPKWTINARTGKTNCFTEPRGSNLVYITCRLKRMSKLNAVEWILGHSVNSVEARYKRIKRIVKPLEPIKEISSFDIAGFEKSIAQGELYQGAISFLSQHCIYPSTARDFGAVEFTEGFYKDRIILPIRDIKKKLVGFVATDILGQERWMKENPTIVDSNTKILRSCLSKDYRKVRYPSGFNVSHYLMGEDSFKKGDIAILVEGFREMMKLRQEGFSGALAVGGSNLSDKQMLTLTKLHPRKVIMMMDGDKAGRMGAKTICEKILFAFGVVYITNLAEGRDPKDLSREEILYYLKNETEECYMDLGSN
jgi:5S rRNA maturation endonuclease (ribonuclease M5)